jgi:fumarate hydratase class II
MPGKVNPVIIESLTMVIARVLGNDLTVTTAGQSGSLFELNVMMPVAGVTALESVKLLAAATRNFAARTIEGLQATERGPELLGKNPILATALNPVIGYDEVAKIAKEAYKTGRSIRELALEKGIAPEVLDKVLDPAKMTEPGLESGGSGAG